MKSFNYFNEYPVHPTLPNISDHLERIRWQGYTILDELITKEESGTYSQLVDKVYATQCAEIGGEENLNKVGEVGVARNLVDYRPEFLDLLTNQDVVSIVGGLLGPYFTIMYQSGIVNTPNVKKYPSSWHRDLIHQNFTSSKPMAITAIFCVDDFTIENGGTVVLPYSHKFEQAPSENFQNDKEVCIQAKKGSVLLLDSMLFHKTGSNISKEIRRAVVNVYCLPFISQPYYFSPKIIDGLSPEKAGFVKRLLGFSNRSEADIVTYRKKRLV